MSFAMSRRISGVDRVPCSTKVTRPVGSDSLCPVSRDCQFKSRFFRQHPAGFALGTRKQTINERLARGARLRPPQRRAKIPFQLSQRCAPINQRLRPIRY
jgi:hypothetical protein